MLWDERSLMGIQRLFIVFLEAFGTLSSVSRKWKEAADVIPQTDRDFCCNVNSNDDDNDSGIKSHTSPLENYPNPGMIWGIVPPISSRSSRGSLSS